MEIPKPNQATSGTRGLRSYGSKRWSLPDHIKISENLNSSKAMSLLYHIKTSENLNSFKAIIKYWDGNH